MSAPEDLWLVVGLGNPGAKFAGNRHNVGQLIVEVLAQRLGSRFAAHRGRADVATTRLDNQRVILAKPRSYMNESGPPVAALRSYFRVEVERIVACHDDLDLDFGRLRLKRGGGEGGHNGLRSMTRSLGSRDYLRVRFGIGRPPPRMDPADYVLHDFTAAQRKELQLLVEAAADAVVQLIGEGLAAAQNRFHAT